MIIIGPPNCFIYKLHVEILTWSVTFFSNVHQESNFFFHLIKTTGIMIATYIDGILFAEGTGHYILC